MSSLSRTLLFSALGRRSNYIFWFLILLCWIHTASAQETSIILEGRVINYKGIGVSFAHIISLKTKYATAADQNGRFLFRSEPGDSLLITAVGLHQAIVNIPQNARSGKHPIIVTLLPDTLHLTEVLISPWPETWPEFRQAFLNLDIPVEHIDLSIPREALVQAIHDANPSGGIYMPGPVSILYEAFSKEARSMRKYQSLVARDKLIEGIRRRLGDKALIQLTQSDSIQEASLKLESCAFQELSLEKATENEIMAAILICLHGTK